MPTQLYLTFDVEDTLNNSSIFALKKTLACLKREKLRAVFFITGGFAEKLKNFKDVVSALCEHEIGFHSSSHSIRPIIAEYTDIADYQEAVEISLNRETSHIDALTGKIEGEGGLLALRELFPDKRIVSFRAPGFSWSPPHSEALKQLDIIYDFSSDVYSKKFSHKGITFFPFPLEIMPPEGNELNFSLYRSLFQRIFSQKTVVIVMHPHSLVNAKPWDSIYWHNNPSKLVECSKKSDAEIKRCISKFSNFLKFVRNLQTIRLVNVGPSLTPANSLNVHLDMVYNSYKRSISWPNQFFNYNPKCMFQHFEKFFDIV